MSAKKITLTTDTLRRERKVKRIVLITLLIIILLLLVFYITIGIIYNNGNFSITLDRNLYYQKGVLVYDDVDYKVFRPELYAESPLSYDNISYKWLPDDINDSKGGSHNGNNYLAYTFYVENTGVEVVDFYSELVIEDVIKNVDEAVRIRVYKDGVPTTYAKKGQNGRDEEGCVSFQNDEYIDIDHIENFKPGDIIKYTLVLWIEGNDPECNDNILGGEFKVSMNFNSEHIND